MRIRDLKAAWALTAASLMLATGRPLLAQSSDTHREGSWEFSLGGGAMFLDSDLRNFLASGTTETRFTNTFDPKSLAPTGVVRVGYNFTPHLGLGISAGIASKDGVTYWSPTEAFTYTFDLNAKTSPFLLGGMDLTRISGQNGRTTHSTWGAHAGLGVRHMVSEHVALRVEGRMQWEGYDEAGMPHHTTMSPIVTAGLSYFTNGRRPQPMMAAMPCPVCQAQAPARVRVDTVYKWAVDTIRTFRVDTVQVGMAESIDQVVLRVQFRTDRAELLPISLPVLNTVAAAILATPNSAWKVEGHTDSTGTPERNRILSQQRAQAVVDYLVTRGVARDILSAQGFGPARPVFSNATAEGRAQNRRVQLRRIPLPPTHVVP